MQLEQPCMIGASLPSRDKAYKKYFSLSNRFLLDIRRAPSLSNNNKPAAGFRRYAGAHALFGVLCAPVHQAGLP
jgi:hypothetical protein